MYFTSMGKWKYRKPEPSTVCGMCVLCKKKKQKASGDGRTYKPLCSYCIKLRYYTRAELTKQADQYKRPYTKHKKSVCEECGFIPKHSCQLDVDHIDGNKKNNSRANLQTLCANCHRLKTFLNEDWRTK